MRNEEDTKEPASLTAQYFRDVYAAHRDPWNFESSPYEAEKYNSSLAILPRERYGSALEVGCSIGVFTHMLADRCDRLLALDLAEQALEEARQRCAQQSQVTFAQCDLPAQFPGGMFDLVTVCEVGYYWSPADLLQACRRIAQQQPTGADLLLVHWTPDVHDYPQRGDAVHDTWLSQPWWQMLAAHRHATYRMDVLRRNDQSCE